MEIDLLTADAPKVVLPVLSEEEQKLVSMVRNTWEDYRTWFESNHRDRIHENYRRYNATVDAYEDADDVWRGVNGHPVRLAIEYAVAETWKSKLLKAIIGNQDYWKILPGNAQARKNADLMQKLVAYQFDKDNFTEKLLQLLDQACRYNVSPWLVYQRQLSKFEEQVLMKKEPIVNAFGLTIGERDVPQSVTVRRYLENRPSLEIYDIESVGFNYALGKYEQSPYYIFRQLIHRGTLAKMFPELAEYINSGLLDWDGVNDYAEDRRGEVGQSSGQAFFQRAGRIEVMYWMEPEGTVVVFGDKLVRRYPNESRSELKEVFTGMYNLFPSVFEPIGTKGPIDLEKENADIWNELINIDLDGTKCASNLIVKVKKNAGVEMDTILFGGSQKWEMDDLDAVEPVEFPYNPGSSLQLLNYIGEKNQQITSATDAAMGTPTKGAKFSSDIQRMAAESNNRYWLALVGLRSEVKKIIRAFVRHNQEYLAPTVSPEHPIVFMVAGERDFDELRIDNEAQLMGEFDYRISLNIEDVDRNTVRAQLITAINIISKNPNLAALANPMEMLKIIFKMFPELPDLENLTGTVEDQLNALLGKMTPEQLSMVMAHLGQVLAQTQAAQVAAPGMPGAQGAAGNAGGGRAAEVGEPPRVVPSDPAAIANAANRDNIGLPPMPGMAG